MSQMEENLIISHSHRAGETLQQACKLSIKTQKPMCFYFYVDSLKGNICIATNDDEKNYI